MDNDEIARRHVTAYLLQRYHQDRLPEIDPEDAAAAVRGARHGARLRRHDVAAQPHRLRGVADARTRATCRSEVDGWLPAELEPRRQTILDGLVTETLADI